MAHRFMIQKLLAHLGVDQCSHAVSVTRKRLLDTELELRTKTERVEAVLDADVLPGIGYYEITLNTYALGSAPFENIKTQPKGLHVVGLDAVDQWSVGFLRDGVFKAYTSAARRKQTPKLPTTLELPLLRGTVAIMVVDVLGNRSVWVPQQA